MTQKQITSSSKIAKAAAKLYRKEMRNETVREAEKLGRVLGNVLKPKPKYIPWKLWLWGIRIFMRVGE